MHKIYCDICKEEIKPEDTHYVARVARNKRWNDKSRTIDICLRCNNVLIDSERTMEEVTNCIWTEPLKSEDNNGLGE